MEHLQMIGLDKVTTACKRYVELWHDNDLIDTLYLDNCTLQDAHNAGVATLDGMPHGTKYKCYIELINDRDGYRLMQAGIEIAAAVIAYANRKGINQSDDSLLARLIKCARLPYHYDYDIDNLRSAAYSGIRESMEVNGDIAAAYKAGYRYARQGVQTRSGEHRAHAGIRPGRCTLAHRASRVRWRGYSDRTTLRVGRAIC